MRDFRDFLDSCSLFDLQYLGNSFTWSNKHVAKKLDRILTNDAWNQRFPAAIGVFGEQGFSDHSPACVFLDQHKPKQKRPFKFFAYLNQHEDFKEFIHITWSSLTFSGTKQFVVSKKLKQLKNCIRCFDKANYSQLEERVEEAYHLLTMAQRTNLANPSVLAAEQKAQAHRTWYKLAGAEDSFLKQSSRIQWTTLGDANTVFYHRAIKSRQGQNHISLLEDLNGSILENLEDIKKHAVEYFSDLLGGSVLSVAPSPDIIASVMPLRCTYADIEMLSALYTDLDIQNAFLSLPSSKAPGPDGYPSEFFKANWYVVGRDMIDAVREFMVTGKILQQWNSTIITLVPKKQNAIKMTEFRPISCCNSVYKTPSRECPSRY
ncbi:hypothetical protein N665_0022s0037 [Sinapis alba]|nr:hypothetical protein N665_0022s0037 [Sinapis alba]